MEIRDWAEAILFAESLEGKLIRPGRPSDRAPGPALPAPRAPGRPPELTLHRRLPRDPTPGPGALHQAHGRAAVLHAFANHELLALELMALALLRFPDAPPAFRRGLVHVATEEQDHLQLYLDRLAATGAELGERPVSAFFWDLLAEAPDPLAFTCGMGLVLEQANLDFSLAWAEAFREAGDAETAAVLQRVHDEEIGHVRHGLAWLRRLKDPSHDELSALRAALPAPLTLRRARGPRFDREGRVRAGLPEALIQAVHLAGHSKGRPPRVHLFEPAVEHHLARPDAPLGPAARALAADLHTLPLLLCGEDDVLLVQGRPGDAFLATLREAGLALPELVEDLGELHDRPLGGLCPWGWSPQVAARLAPLAPSCQADPTTWDPRWRPLYSKAWAAHLARELLDGDDPDLAPPRAVGVACGDLEAVRQALGVLGGPCLVKGAFSASGRERRRMHGEPGEADRRWLQATLSRHGEVVVQPWLDRVVDLSVLGTVGESVRLRGVSRFLTTPDGRYQGTVLGRHTAGLPPELARFLHRGGQPWATRALEDAARRVGAALLQAGYRGPFGVDAMVYRDGPRLRLLPLLEVNPRTTMGHLALALARLVAPGARATFRLHPLAGRDGAREADRLRRPLVLRDGRIRSGVLFTTEPERAQAVLSFLEVG